MTLSLRHAASPFAMFFLLLVLPALASGQAHDHGPADAAGQVHDHGDTVLRGAPIGGSRVVPLATVLADPAAYTSQPVVVEGVVERACTSKGCWMQVVPAKGEAGVRVTFKDYAFFIPTSAAGMKARAEGVVTTRELSKKDADHLEERGAMLKRSADGTATEIGFVATGVELRP